METATHYFTVGWQVQQYCFYFKLGSHPEMCLYLLCWSIERIAAEQTCQVDLSCGWSWYTANVLVSIPILENGQFSGPYLTHHQSLFYFKKFLIKKIFSNLCFSLTLKVLMIIERKCMIKVLFVILSLLFIPRV